MSLAFEIVARAGQTEPVYTAAAWTELVVLCLGDPAVEHRLSFGNGPGAAVVPGAPLTLTLSPDTEVRLSTTAASDVRWSLFATALPIEPIRHPRRGRAPQTR